MTRAAKFKKVLCLFVCFAFVAASLIAGCQKSQSMNAAESTPCGFGEAPRTLNGVFWLLGSPTTANVMCTAQEGRYKLVQTLDPDSRDPLLLKDTFTGHILLLERFSGGRARPSRVTWFSEAGQMLSQRGDWPQNVQSVMRTSANDGLVNGFDFSDLRRFSWLQQEPLSLGRLDSLFRTPAQFRPVATLQKGEWVASVDVGYDLVRFQAQIANVAIFKQSEPTVVVQQVPLTDALQGISCRNAFQTLQVNNSRVILSCNPQYFGPAGGEVVSVFSVELNDLGELRVSQMLSRDAQNIQRIELWGISADEQQIFIGLKKTAVDDYQGTLVGAGWLSLSKPGSFAQETRFSGPLIAKSSEQFIVACQQDSSGCRAGEFLLVSGSGADAVSVRTGFSLPFLSFAASVPRP